MERGYIRINIEEGKPPTIEAQLVNSDLWMTKYEMLHFFNCFGQKIEMNLRSIFKDRLLIESEVSYSYRYRDKGTDKEAIFYNLEVLIFLGYRIGTLEAKIFRQFVNSALREHLQRNENERFKKFLWHFGTHQECLLN
jgi:hypothetical protein